MLERGILFLGFVAVLAMGASTIQATMARLPEGKDVLIVQDDDQDLPPRCFQSLKALIECTNR